MSYHKLFIIAFLFIATCISKKEWYRSLPDAPLPNEEIPLGKYKKKTHSRAPLNSSYIFHENQEEILLLPNEKFIKNYVSTWEKGEITQKTMIVTKGSYKKNGRWVLLTTEFFEYEFFENGKKLQERKVDTKHTLLYYFWKNEKVLVPMIFERGLDEKNFGVKDGVTTPYDDSSAYFLRYLRFYTYEEYQSHAYFWEP